MAITNYNELKAALQDWSARDDVLARLDEFIDLCESMLRRPPSSVTIGGIRANKTLVTGTLTPGSNTLALPADYLELDRLTVANQELSFVPPTNLKRIRGQGRPFRFTIHDAIEFGRPADSDYDYELSYWPSFAPLSDDTPTNWVLDTFPDVYLAGSMYWLRTWTRDQDEAAQWAIQYRGAAAAANLMYLRGRQSQGSINIQPDIRVC